MNKESDISPSVFGVLAISSAVSGTIMFLLCMGMYFQNKVPMPFLISYYLVGVLATDVYGMMTYASALKRYKALTFGFFLGFLLAVGVYFLSTRQLDIDKVTAAYMGLAAVNLWLYWLWYSSA